MNRQEVDITIHFDDQVVRLLQRILRMEQQEMATLSDIQAEVEATSGVVDSAVLLLTTLHDELVAALASNDPTAVQAIVDQLDSTKTALADAVAANADPTPPVE